MSESYKAYLQHILEECLFIEISLVAIKSMEEMVQDEEKKRAIVRSMEIIGEATKKIPADMKLKWKQIEWKSIEGMRDKLIHDNMDVDYEIVWDTAKRKIPVLKVEIEKILMND